MHLTVDVPGHVSGKEAAEGRRHTSLIKLGQVVIIFTILPKSISIITYCFHSFHENLLGVVRAHKLVSRVFYTY